MFLRNPSTFQEGIVDEIEKILGPELGQIWRIAYANSSCVKKTELGRCLLVYRFGGCSKETPKMDKPGEDDQVAQRRRGTWADGQIPSAAAPRVRPRDQRGFEACLKHSENCRAFCTMWCTAEVQFWRGQRGKRERNGHGHLRVRSVHLVGNSRPMRNSQ